MPVPNTILLLLITVITLLFIGCSQNQNLNDDLQQNPINNINQEKGSEMESQEGDYREVLPDRKIKIPEEAIKVIPENDRYPPVLHSEEYSEPVPLSFNTAGAEDSPFVPEGKDEIYFFFTPNVNIPVEKQVLDGVTGIYVSKKDNRQWGEPERVMLQDRGKLALDGCEFVTGDTILFCSVREGYSGVHWFSAEYSNGKWKNWKNSDFDESYEVGELHIYEGKLYFHSSRPGGKGGLDIWVSKNKDGVWEGPENLNNVNSEGNEGWPFVTREGDKLWLWFTRTYMGTPAIFRSAMNEEKRGWGEPELVISQFAGEPTLDKDGNIYFVHHFYDDGKMIEADIYVAYKK